MAGFDPSVSSKQTAYKAVADVVAALVNAGFVDDSTAWDLMEEKAQVVYKDILSASSTGADTPTRQPEPENPGDYKFTWGRNNGKSVSQVAEEDPSYLEWLVEKDSNKARDGARGFAKKYLESARAGV